MKRFLRALYKHRSQHRFRVPHKHVLDFAYAELPRDPDFERILKPKKRKAIAECGYKWAVDGLHSELRTLGSHEPFGEFRPPSDDQDLGLMPFIRDATPTITELAPQWLHLIQRVSNDSTFSSNPSIIQPATLILATLCHLLQPQKCSNFQTTLGLHLYRGGASRRVLATLCRIRLIVSYTTLQRRLKLVRASAEHPVEAVGQAPSTIESTPYTDIVTQLAPAVATVPSNY